MRCRECPIGELATQSVIGEGRLKAPLFFEVGIPRDAVLVSNAVKHFKFELRGN